MLGAGQVRGYLPRHIHELDIYISPPQIMKSGTTKKIWDMDFTLGLVELFVENKFV